MKDVINILLAPAIAILLMILVGFLITLCSETDAFVIANAQRFWFWFQLEDDQIIAVDDLALVLLAELA